MQRFENIQHIEDRAGAHIYECVFEGKPAIVKFITKAGLPRFKRERVALEAGQGLVPDLYHYGDTDYLYAGGKHFVMENLHFDYHKVFGANHKKFFHAALLNLWELFRRDVYANPKLRNLGVDTKGNLKWFDFNDDTPGELGFKPFHFADYFKPGHAMSLDIFFAKYAKKYRLMITPKYIRDVIESFIAKMYPTLINVHEPIAIPAIEKTFRTETEKADPNYGKPAVPNRNCYDRWKMIMSTHDNEWWAGRKVMDVGANAGWFSINFGRKKAEVVGYEIDKEKAEFGRLVATHERLDNVKFESDTPLARKKDADFIILLSTLNRWVLTEKEAAIIGPSDSKKEERQKILKKLWDLTDEMVVEIPNYWIKGAMEGDFVPFMDRLGADMRVLGTSDNGRKLFYFARRK